MTAVDPAQVAYELKWLRDHPEFEERPATIREFLGPSYLNMPDGFVREIIIDTLEDIFGAEVSSDAIAAYALAMITGGIGIGKTTIASIILPYLAHWVLCLKDPQGFFHLLPGSRIAFMQMSTSGNQAKEVVFGDIKARVDHAPWFRKYPYDKKRKLQIRFPKDVWILPGDSAETTFEGYNILGGILDEADSHQVTENKDYAEQGYSTINSRIESRFARVPRKDPHTGEVVERSYGFLLVIGQMKKSNGFAARKYKEFMERKDAYARKFAIWESLGWSRFLNPDGTRDSFWYNSERFEIVPPGILSIMSPEDSSHLIEVPNSYRESFVNDPQKALRDLAGIPPVSGSPFIALTYKITECRDRWIARYNKNIEEGEEVFEGPVRPDGKFEPWFRAVDSLKRACHLDIAYSAKGDGAGIAMGHVPEMVTIGDETKPYIVFDMIMRVHATPGREIQLSDLRHVIYSMRDDLGFKVVYCSMDGFQSVDTRQQMQKRRIAVEEVSVDKKLAPYEDLREAIYEGRVDFPKYMVQLRETDTELTEIAVKELMELVDNGRKIDHPDGGSKDVADAMAGVCHALMGDRTYHRKVRTLGTAQMGTTESVESTGFDPLARLDMGAHAPLPPTGDGAGPLWRPPTY